MVIRTRLPALIGASAITIFPFILVDPRFGYYAGILPHERVHYVQQKRWFIRGVGLGLILWWLLYLLVLPIGWNPFRKKWETEAYKAQGLDQETIDNILRHKPYYLW